MRLKKRAIRSYNLLLKDSSLAAALLCWFTLSEITTICKLIQDKVIVIIIMKMRISGRKIEYTNKMDDNSKIFIIPNS